MYMNTHRHVDINLGVYAGSHRVEVDSIKLLRQCLELLLVQGLGPPHQGYIFWASGQQAGHQWDTKERKLGFLVATPTQHSPYAFEPTPR